METEDVGIEVRVARASPESMIQGNPLRNNLRVPPHITVFFHWPDSKKDDSGFLGSALHAERAPFIATRRPTHFDQTFQTQDRFRLLRREGAGGVQGISLFTSDISRLTATGDPNAIVYLVLPGHCFVLFTRSRGPSDALLWKRKVLYENIENPDARLCAIPLRVRAGGIQIQEPPEARLSQEARSRVPDEPLTDVTLYAANDSWYAKTTVAPEDAAGVDDEEAGGWVKAQSGAELHVLCMAIIPYGGGANLDDVLSRVRLNADNPWHQPVIQLRDAIIPYVSFQQASYDARIWERIPRRGNDLHGAQEDEYPRFDERDLELHRPLTDEELRTVSRCHRAPREFLRFPPDTPDTRSDPEAPQTYTDAMPSFGLEPLRFDERTLDGDARIEPHVPLPKSDLLIGLERLNALFAEDPQNPGEEPFLGIVTGFIPPSRVVEALSEQKGPRINQIRHIFGDAVDLERAVADTDRFSFEEREGRQHAVGRLVPFPDVFEERAAAVRHHFDRMNWERIFIESRHVLHVDVRGYQLPALAGLYEGGGGQILSDSTRRPTLAAAHCNTVDVVVGGAFGSADTYEFFRVKYHSEVLEDRRVFSRPAKELEVGEGSRESLFSFCEARQIYLTLNMRTPRGTPTDVFKKVIQELFVKFGDRSNFLGVTADLEAIVLGASALKIEEIKNSLLETANMLAGQLPWPGEEEPRAMPGKLLIPIYTVDSKTSRSIPWEDIPRLQDVLVPLGYGRWDMPPDHVASVLVQIHESKLMDKVLTGDEGRDISILNLATYPNLPGPSGLGTHFSPPQVAPYRMPLTVWWAETARLYGANLLLYHFSKWGYANDGWVPELSAVLPNITTIARPRTVW